MTDPLAITAYWDAAAPAFDDEPDHGLRAGETRAAWSRLLAGLLPAARWTCWTWAVGRGRSRGCSRRRAIGSRVWICRPG